MSDKKLLTISQYARHRGCSHEAVRKAIDCGRIPKQLDESGKRHQIDPDIADKCWEQNTNKAKQKGGDAVRKKYVKYTVETDTTEDADEEPESEESKALPRYNESIKKKEYYKAEMAKMDFEEKQGTLVKADEVKRAAFDMARTLREQLYNIPDRLAQTLAVESDPDRVHAEIIRELDQILGELASIS